MGINEPCNNASSTSGGFVIDWSLATARVQEAMPDAPYDRWVSPAGVVMAEFYRSGDDFVVRFPGQADFTLRPDKTPGGFDVIAHLAPDCAEDAVRTLVNNAITPIIGNYHGGKFLHGSAVAISDITGAEDAGIAFLGLSRSGKTTLAGAFAKAGHPFVTEDVIDIDLHDRVYRLHPKPSGLRLFADSAQHLIGNNPRFEDRDRKQEVAAGAALPFARAPVPLRHIYILGPDHDAQLAIRRLSSSEALAAILPHAFILDVEDRSRLRAHFMRMADLTQTIACHTLDYRRDYAELPAVIEAILASFSAD